MSVINYANRVIDFKIVYYGPGMAGKTANLQYIHRCLPNANRGNMISLATGDDRTIYFDFLPVSALTVRGFQTRFQLYTVPGQVQYNATRRLVLRGADGLVFVADSQFERLRENVESFRNLETNLREYESTLDEIPYVLQYNKRDLPNLAPLAYLEFVLNRRAARVACFVAAAIHGEGGVATLYTPSRMGPAGGVGGGRGERKEAP